MRKLKAVKSPTTLGSEGKVFTRRRSLASENRGGGEQGCKCEPNTKGGWRAWDRSISHFLQLLHGRTERGAVSGVPIGNSESVFGEVALG